MSEIAKMQHSETKTFLILIERLPDRSLILP